MYTNLEDYAEHIRIEMHRMMVLTGRDLGTDHVAFQMAAGLCTEAAGIVHGNQMEREREGIEELDLTTLPPLVPVETSENPFAEE